MWGRPGCLHQSAGWGTNRILLASALSSMGIICPNRVSYSSEFVLVRLPPYIIVPNKLVPFDAKQHTQTSLVECIDIYYTQYSSSLDI